MGCWCGMWSAYQNLAHGKATGLYYSTVSTREFNIRFMSLSNKTATGKAVFQILSMSWIENRSGLTTFSFPSPHSIRPEQADSYHTSGPAMPSRPLGRQNGESPLGHTHTKGSLPFLSLAFLCRQWMLKRSCQVVPPGWTRADPPSFTSEARPAQQDSTSCLLPHSNTHPNAVQEWSNRSLSSKASVSLTNKI